MRLLIDSHILMWWDTAPERLSQAQRSALGDPANQVYVSAVTAWELGIKKASGKLILNEPVEVLTARLGFFKLPVTLAHGDAATFLAMHHKDPFDRMLIAQTMLEKMTLVSADRQLSAYAQVALLT